MLFFFTLVATLATIAHAQQCYFPDGSPADNGTVPCNTSAKNSHCCGMSDICLSNGLCWDQDSTYYNRMVRAACTDASFKDEACPQYCAEANTQGAVSVFLAYDEEHGSFCCGGSYDPSSRQCTVANSGSYDPFSITQGLVIIDRNDGTTWYNNASLSRLGSTTNASGTNASSAAGATVTETSVDNSHPNVTAVAAGIAVPLGVLFLASLAAAVVFFTQNRRLKTQLAERSQIPLVSPSQGYNALGVTKSPIRSEMGEHTMFPQISESDGRPVNELPGTEPHKGD